MRKGEYYAPTTSDLRSPCPIVNALANHGYIPRDGRNVRSHEMYAAMAELGVSWTVRATLTWGSCKQVNSTYASLQLWAFGNWDLDWLHGSLLDLVLGLTFHCQSMITIADSRLIRSRTP